MRWSEETQEAVLRSASFDFDEEGSKHALGLWTSEVVGLDKSIAELSRFELVSISAEREEQEMRSE